MVRAVLRPALAVLLIFPIGARGFNFRVFLCTGVREKKPERKKRGTALPKLRVAGEVIFFDHIDPFQWKTN